MLQSSIAQLVIPDETKQKFPELVELILGSESMNDEERQYWINILPAMTPDQLKSLDKILTTEKKQLAAIDKKYAKEIDEIGKEKVIAKTAEERRKKKKKRVKKETTSREEDESAAEDLLKEIEG